MRKGTTVNGLAAQILAEVGADFKNRQLDSTALHVGYVGLPIIGLKARYAAGAEVDFDLAILQLEKGRLVTTGPWTRDINSPNSSLVVIGNMRSKREYLCLTERGYRELQKRPARQISPHPTVHISGGHFHHSPIGVGGIVNQTVSFEGRNDLEALQQFVAAFESHLDDLALDPAARRKAAAQVSTIKAQLSDEPDPVIVGQAGRTLRNVTEGAIGSLLATAVQPSIWDGIRQAMQHLFR